MEIMLKRDLISLVSIEQLGINREIWEQVGLTGRISDDPPCPYRTNSSASREWEGISGCALGAPTETMFPNNRGNQCTHWDEFCMKDEVMTGNPYRIGSDPFRFPISRITVGTLEDIGYKVDYAAADAYTEADIDPTCLCSTNPVDPTNTTSTRSLATKGRKLSDEGLQAATAYALSRLEKHLASSQSYLVDEGLYIQGRTVNVYYLENATVFRIAVSA
jgi:hypothetical protein